MALSINQNISSIKSYSQSSGFASTMKKFDEADKVLTGMANRVLSQNTGGLRINQGGQSLADLGNNTAGTSVNITSMAGRMSQTIAAGSSSGLQAANDNVSKLSFQRDTLSAVTSRLEKIEGMAKTGFRVAGNGLRSAMSSEDRTALQNEFNGAVQELNSFVQNLDTTGQEDFVGGIKKQLSNVSVDNITTKRSPGMQAGMVKDELLYQQSQVSEDLARAQSQAQSQSQVQGIPLDTNTAFTTSNNVRGQILAQAGTAMLAQANVAPQQVLSMLR